MEIRDLKSFMSVVEQGSYTKAAQTYFVSQPSLSKSIKKLEDVLQIELLDRSTRHVVLTDAGRIVYEQGQGILKSVEDIHSLLEDLMNIKSGTIKIGMPPLIGRMFFPEIARSFSRKYPKVKLELIERGAKLIGSMVESGQVDVGFVVLPSDPKRFHIHPFIEDTFCLYVHKEHHLAQLASVTLQQLEAESFILFTEEFTLHDFVIKSCKAAGFQPEISYKSSQWDLILELVASNLGITLLPQSISEKQMSDQVKIIPIQDVELLWRIAVITKMGAYQSYALKCFLQNTIAQD